jgi:hypothetical protein
VPPLELLTRISSAHPLWYTVTPLYARPPSDFVAQPPLVLFQAVQTAWDVPMAKISYVPFGKYSGMVMVPYWQMIVPR